MYYIWYDNDWNFVITGGFPTISIYGMIEIRYKGRKEQILKRMEWG